MAGKQKAVSALKFIGTPNRLYFNGELKPDLTGLQMLEPTGKLKTLANNQPLQAQFRGSEGQDSSQARLRLNRTTPPGNYKARLRSGRKSYPVNLTVEPYLRLKFRRAETLFSGIPGRVARAHIQVFNKGNVAFEFPHNNVCGIYVEKGVETAFASMYRQSTEDVDTLLKHFLSKLRDGHGGLLKIRTLGGSVLVEPGHTENIRLSAQLPSKLKAGHYYHGVWRLENVHQRIKVFAENSKGGK